ncbi:hypothetical protein QP933_01195 [Corynebacterium pseudodiphtheriticum]|uniref:hypothetical protein n=1 Tax=Corynebacterium pseudodiphtheriticum TaxID=37637 RepID=UPI00254FB982|nr:hypothetical protein [Corynebacterium pseudodiphtheriticum]MDK8499560.1 hypothetical protein [Corynebacterium pseudodiphtheriticum]MDK8583406.1 hypothetical protein [Corynebacterium pseudodiphtheriticum]MDK8838784.1 hypothetical protein [Corynebacterium pseudodiphtheriticum]
MYAIDELLNDDEFLDAVHHLLASRDQVDELVDKAVRAELNTTDLHIEADQLFARVGAAAETIDALITRNSRVDGTITFTFKDRRSQAISFKK